MGEAVSGEASGEVSGGGRRAGGRAGGPGMRGEAGGGEGCGARAGPITCIRFSRRFFDGPLPWNFHESWRNACFCVILRPYSSK